MSDLAKVMMTPREARKRVATINSSMNNIRALLLDFHEREGWKALGYESWRACAAAEFHQSERYLHRQLEAAQAEKAMDRPIGQKPEARLRPLIGLPPEEKKEVYQKAVETVQEGKVTARQDVMEKITEHKRPTRLMPEETEKVGTLFKVAFDNMVSVIKNEKAFKWKDTSKDDALKYVQILARLVTEEIESPNQGE